jgi:hypothetical protein
VWNLSRKKGKADLSPAPSAMITLFPKHRKHLESHGFALYRALQTLGFQRHSLDTRQHGLSALALLSCLFPYKRPDRVYGLREKKLISIIAYAWELGYSHRDKLQQLQNEGSGLDFPSTIRAAVKEGGESVTLQNTPTVEEVNCALDRLASTYNFSSPQVHQVDAGKVVNTREELIRLFRRLRGLEVELMIRLLFKDLSPAHVPEATMIQLFHPSLAWALQIRNSPSGALELLEPLISKEDSGSSTAPAIFDSKKNNCDAATNRDHGGLADFRESTEHQTLPPASGSEGGQC